MKLNKKKTIPRSAYHENKKGQIHLAVNEAIKKSEVKECTVQYNQW